MKNLLLIFIVSIGIAFGCRPTDEEILPIQNLNKTWENSFFEVLNGASTLKINFQLNKPGSFHYIVSESEIENIDANYIRTQSQKISEAGIVSSGILEVKSNTGGDTSEILIPELISEKPYYTYTLSETEEIGKDGEVLPIIIKQFSNVLEVRQKVTEFESSTMKHKMSFLTYSLEDYYLNPTKNYPLLIFLHGMGEYAAEGEINLYRNTTIPDLIKKGNDYPFIVISPQLNTGSWSPDFVNEIIDHVIENYRVDTSRIYMTGISLGGIGTWNYATTYPERLAAVVPISGSGNVGKACNMFDVPVWAFHNSSDGLVNTSGSVNMVNALNDCSEKCPVPPTLTIYPDAGHNAWVRTYNGSAGHDIFSWFLNYQR